MLVLARLKPDSLLRYWLAAQARKAKFDPTCFPSETKFRLLIRQFLAGIPNHPGNFHEEKAKILWFISSYFAMPVFNHTLIKKRHTRSIATKKMFFFLILGSLFGVLAL